MKNKKGFSTITLVIYLSFIAALFAFAYSVTPGAFGGKAASDQYLKSCAGELDEALAIYYDNHSGMYPENLSTLQTLGHIPANFPVSSFTYTTNAGYTQYRISVILASGTVYISPNSKM